MHEWNVSTDFDAASKAAAEFLASRIQHTVEHNGCCHVVLPGGNTPAKCLQYLSEMDLPWEKIHWYPGDERVLPKGDAERNDVMLDKNLWSKLPAGNIHTIPVELGTEQSAEAYRQQLAETKIDIAFLGMGEDGHTASLFPDNDALKDERSVIAVYNSPKPPKERVSFSVNKLQQAEYRMILTCGEGKADIINQIKQGRNLPVNQIGDINWFVDKLAYSGKS